WAFASPGCSVPAVTHRSLSGADGLQYPPRFDDGKHAHRPSRRAVRVLCRLVATDYAASHWEVSRREESNDRSSDITAMAAGPAGAGLGLVVARQCRRTQSSRGCLQMAGPDQVESAERGRGAKLGAGR